MKKINKVSMRYLCYLIISCLLIQQVLVIFLIAPVYGYPVIPPAADPAPSLGQETPVKYKQVEVGELGAMALDYRGDVWVWGYNLYGELGNGKLGNVIAGDLVTTDQQAYAGGIQRVPRFRDASIRIVKIARGERSCYALDAEGNLWTWGLNEYGQLIRDTSVYSTQLGNYGQGSAEYGNIPQKADLPAEIKKIVKMEAGAWGIMILDDKGSIWCCGWNGYGEHGQGNVTNTREYRRTLHKVNFGSIRITDISCGYNHRMVLDENGDLWSWGWNNYGQLGNDSILTVGFTSPAKIKRPPEMTGKIIKISNGVWNSQALCDDDTVWEWGKIFGNQEQTMPTANIYTVFQRVPRKVAIDITPGKPRISALQGDYYGGYFTDINGNVWSWGSNVHYIFGYNAYPGGGRVGTLEDPTYNMTDRTARWRPYMVGDGNRNPDGVSPYTADVGGLHVQGGAYAGERLPFIVQIESYDEIHAALDVDGNIWIWSYGGSGRIAYGFAGDPGMLPMHALGAEKTINGLYDRYAYEPILLSGTTPYTKPQIFISGAKNKIYKNLGESSPVKDKITVDISIPDHIEIGSTWNTETIETQMESVRYVQLDPGNPYFNDDPGANGGVMFDKAYAEAANSRKGTIYDRSSEKNELKETVRVTKVNQTENSISGTARPGYKVEIDFPNIRQGPNDLYAPPSYNTTVNGRLYYGNDKPANEPLALAPGQSTYFAGTVTTGVGTHINPKTIRASAPVDEDGKWKITIPQTTIKLSIAETNTQLPPVKIQSWDRLNILVKNPAGQVIHSGKIAPYQAKSMVKSGEIEIDDNCKIWVMLDEGIGQVGNKVIAAYTADHFYTRARLKNKGMDVAPPYITAYEAFKYDETPDGKDYGIPLWDKKDKDGNLIGENGETVKDPSTYRPTEMIRNPSLGYDTVHISRYDEIKSPGFDPGDFEKIWEWSDINPDYSQQKESGRYELDTLEYFFPERNSELPGNTHVFYYQKKPGAWVNVTYEGKMKDSDTLLTDFEMENNPESVVRNMEITRETPDIKNLVCVGYRINGGKLTDIQNGAARFTPAADTTVTYVYIQRFKGRKIYIRQIIMEPNKIEIPLAGYMKLNHTDEDGTGVKGVFNIMTSTGKTGDDVPYSLFLLPDLDSAHMFYDVSVIIPEYYSYMGFTLRYGDNPHDMSDLKSSLPHIDYSLESEAWLDIYIKPYAGAPDKYNWDYATNHFGQIR